MLRLALMVRAISADVPLLLTIFDPTMAEQVGSPAQHARDLDGGHRRAVAGGPVHRRALHVGDASRTESPSASSRATTACAEETIGSPRPLASKRSRGRSSRPTTRAPGCCCSARSASSPSSRSRRSRRCSRSTRAHRRDLRLGEDARHGRSQPGGRRRAGLVQAVHLGTMLVALLFAAAFTAGLVNRVVERRLTGLIGRNAVPRRDHVVVVGLGQVGMRLCLLLRACRIPSSRSSPTRTASASGSPRSSACRWSSAAAADPSLMRRLSLHRARAVAAVTADDLENISVAMTARGIHADIRTVLRVGDGDVANETRSLLALGIVRDVHRLAARCWPRRSSAAAPRASSASATRRTCASPTAGWSARSSTPSRSRSRSGQRHPWLRHNTCPLGHPCADHPARQNPHTPQPDPRCSLPFRPFARLAPDKEPPCVAPEPPAVSSAAPPR